MTKTGKNVTVFSTNQRSASFVHRHFSKGQSASCNAWLICLYFQSHNCKPARDQKQITII